MEITSLENCVGCGACAACCPVSAISLTRRQGGFFYPYVVEHRCIGCGLCRESCPCNHPPGLDRLPRPHCYTVSAVCGLPQSSREGVLAVLGQAVLSQGGAVFGTRWGNLHSAHPVLFAGARHGGELDALLCQKLLRGQTGLGYTEARWLLSAGACLLYIGTPCQIAGLYAALGGASEGLVTCDILCDGNPSPHLFRLWIQNMEGRQGAPVTEISFGSAGQGHARDSIRICFADGQHYTGRLSDTSYGRGYRMGLTLRPCCSRCPNGQFPRRGDITLGDGCEGTLVLVNSQKGGALLRAAVGQMVLRPRSLSQIGSGYPLLTVLPKAHPLQAAFDRDKDTMTYSELARVYFNRSARAASRRIR